MLFAFREVSSKSRRTQTNQPLVYKRAKMGQDYSIQNFKENVSQEPLIPHQPVDKIAMFNLSRILRLKSLQSYWKRLLACMRANSYVYLPS